MKLEQEIQTTRKRIREFLGQMWSRSGYSLFQAPDYQPQPKGGDFVEGEDVFEESIRNLLNRKSDSKRTR